MSDDRGSVSSFPLKEVRRRPNKRRKAPKGKLEAVVTYLEMTRRPNTGRLPPS